MTEAWKDVPGYEGMYQVSNCGNVRSLRYATRSGMKDLNPPRPKQLRDDKLGYKIVNLGLNWTIKTYRVHRLVVDAFIGPPPRPRSIIRHMDGDKTNNCVENLVYGSQQENIEDSRRHGVLKGAAVIGFFENGAVKVYDYAAHAEKDGFTPSLISAVIAGRQKRHGGAVWKRLGVESFSIALREMIEAEREACAKVCDNRYMFMGDDADRAVEGCAAAIRYRNVESC